LEGIKMPFKQSRALAALGVIALAYAAIWYVWVQNHQILGTLAIFGASIWALAKFAGSAGEAHLAPESATAPQTKAPQPKPEISDPKHPNPALLLVLGLGGLGSAWLAYQAVLAEHWISALILLLLGALAWRSGLPLRLPTLPRSIGASLLALALLSGGLFRLNEIGRVPTGMAMYDEPVLKMIGQSMVAGERPTAIMMPGVMGDGSIPYYLEGLSVGLFGKSLTGFRLGAALIGTLIVALLFLLGTDMGGPWLGLAAAFLWAVSLWPVTISRANYLMVETHLMVLLCIFFLVRALEKQSSLLFALAGLFWAFTMQVYHAGQIMLAVVPCLLMLSWYLKPARRQSLWDGLPPLLGGMLLGLGPILLWAITDPRDAYLTFFGVLFAGHTAGSVGNSAGILQVLDTVLGRVLPCFPKTFWMLTKEGPFHAYFFPSITESSGGFPLLPPAILFLFLTGVSLCLARFRNPYHAFLLMWWAAALVPGLAGDPGSQPDDRRSMMLLPPLLLIASVGFIAAMDFLSRALAQGRRLPILLLLGLLASGILAQSSWQQYFERNQKDHGLLSWDFANQVVQGRAIYDESVKGPIAVVSTQRLNQDAWNDPNDNRFNTVYQALITSPVTYTQGTQDYYSNEGLFSSLKWAMSQPEVSGQKPDILVALTPFHFYLEPLLLRLGGKTVAQIPVVQSSSGPVLSGLGMAPPVDGLGMKLVRIHGLRGDALEAERKRSLFQIDTEELFPPNNRNRRVLSTEHVFSEDILELTREYEQSPGAWSTARKVSFKVPDPWFWMNCGNLPAAVVPPLRLRVHFKLEIPADGLYAFGASATPYSTLRIDGRRVFRFFPTSGEIYAKAREGILGDPIFLKAGSHRLDAEQFWLSPTGNYNHVFRLVWKKPNAEMESLPLEQLQAAIP
jgi:4-amino-4-deoxy-L-arabinose transferase-like glycosyltransferase